MEEIFKKVKGLLISGALLFIIFGILPATAQATTLYFSPSSGSHAVGTTFTASVNVSSADQAMNGASGVMSFPSDKLAVESLSKSGSIFSLWVQEPSFSNSAGTIDFEGVVLNPGFTGANGKAITITFRTKAAGNAPLAFSSGSVLANDGKGTNILTGMQGANFTLTPPVPTSAIGTVTTKSSTPTELAVSSNPRIVDDQWYNLNTITFIWQLPANADGVEYAISSDPAHALPDVSQGLTSSATYDTTTMADGIWYFSVNVEGGGVWSKPTVRILRLDRTPPDPFIIVEKNVGVPATPAFQWAATDRTSGIAYYRARIGGGDWFDPNTIAQGSLYILPPQSSTNLRTFTVRAYDNAGNFTDASIDFKIVATCASTDVRCVLGPFFTQWLWLFVLILIAIMALAYWFLYRVFSWKRILRAELDHFKKELQGNLKRLEELVDSSPEKGGKIDLRPAHLASEERFIKKEVEQIKEETEKEIEKIKKIAGDK